MFYLWSSDKFSNYLKKSFPEPRIVDHHDKDIRQALTLIRQGLPVNDFLQRAAWPVERTTLVARDVSGNFFYLFYDKESPVAVVFDEHISHILEVVFDPALLEKAYGKREETPDYFELARRFMGALPPFPTVESLIEENESELYFIDTQQAKAKHFRRQCDVFFEYLEPVAPKLKCLVYRQTPLAFTILAQNRFDITLPGRDPELAELFKEEQTIVLSRQKGGRMRIVSHAAPDTFEIIEFPDTLFLSPSQTDALHLMAATLLNLWRLAL